MRKGGLGIGAVVFAVALVVSLPAAAQGDLLKRGGDLLKGLGVSDGDDGDGGGAALTDLEIGDGLREALRVGTERVTASLGQTDGFNLDPDVHIPLPGTLGTVQSALERVGLSSLTDDLELRLNRAAEAAAPHAKELFWQAISEMTLEDVQGILNGPENAATAFFQSKMTPPLTERFTPIVDDELAKAGAVQAYDRALGDYKKIPFVPDAQADLSSYVVEKALDGVFLYLGREEAAIRQDPLKRSTDILKRVFGSV